MIRFAASALILATLSGCSTVQREDGSFNKTATYGGVGALAGAVAGALIAKDNRGQGALLGAAVAGAAGAGYGYYVDKQEAELRESLKGSGVDVQRNGDQLTLVMPGSITFETGSADIQPGFRATLDQLAGSFNQYQGSGLEVRGHTDSVGNPQANQSLSEQRAWSVARYLQGRGVDLARLQVTGAGSTQPVMVNTSAEGRAANRRVEIIMRPQQQQISTR